MSQRRKKGPGTVRHAGRVTVSVCKARGGERPCVPLNRISLWDARGRLKEWCTCTCGRRYRANDPDAPDHLLEPLGPIESVAPGASADWPADQLLAADEELPHAAVGIVPLGTAALHEPTRPVGEITDDVRSFVKHLVSVMHHAPGVGLAANQVGLPVRLFVQVHKRAAPEAFVDPEIRATTSVWGYNEGCLSLQVEGAHLDVRRPKRVQVRARTVHGESFEITADEVVGRILQHEIDHLDGLMYLQRSEPPGRDELYELLDREGIDTSVVPPTPYVGLR